MLPLAEKTKSAKKGIKKALGLYRLRFLSCFLALLFVFLGGRNLPRFLLGWSQNPVVIGAPFQQSSHLPVVQLGRGIAEVAGWSLVVNHPRQNNTSLELRSVFENKMAARNRSEIQKSTNSKTVIQYTKGLDVSKKVIIFVAK